MTTSETGDSAGFTLLEILLVLALIGLMGTIFIGGSQALLADKGKSLDEQFWEVCAKARKMALEDRQSVLLSYDPKAKGFLLADGAAHTGVPVTGPDDTMIDFHPAQADSGSQVLVAGTLVETQPLTNVTFYNDGTCTPFRVQIRADNGAHLLAIDPWTCAPILSPGDARPN
jgi:prepilin-type N-terminal cleavage/methylation domain-containing protein